MAVWISKSNRISSVEWDTCRRKRSNSCSTSSLAPSISVTSRVTYRVDLRTVYAISLTAIDLDTNKEARYLHELSHELELSHEEVNYLHAQVGAPRIF